MSLLERANEPFQVDPEDLIVPVLCYPFPEVDNLLGSLSLHQSFNSPLLGVSEARELLFQGGYSFHEDLYIPVTARGRVDFERLHEPVAARIAERNESQLVGLSDFEKQYTTLGSSDAIHRLMSGWSAQGTMKELGFIAGEYDGYLLEADALGIDIHPVASLEEAGDPVEGRVWFISNPSAVNGNWHDSEVLQNFIEAGHDIVIDYAYGGLVPDEHPVDVSAENIKAVLISPSKIFGVFNYRYTSIALTREEVKTLISTMWFKSISGLMNTLMLHETFGLHELPRKYKPQQLLICDAVGRLVGKEVKASDNILMAHTNEELTPEYALFASAPKNYRFRLSTLFKLLEEYGAAEAC